MRTILPRLALLAGGARCSGNFVLPIEFFSWIIPTELYMYQVYVTEVLSSSKMMTIDSFGPEQSASARRGRKSKTNNATPSYAAQEPLLPQVREACGVGARGVRGKEQGRGGGGTYSVSGAACLQSLYSWRSPGRRHVSRRPWGRRSH